ncbi:MAG TPA: low affinity iron permease family protein [Blastocatellia bacterium]|nr:low affinity iron permease family protein [Blastocatellia bacterium]
MRETFRRISDNIAEMSGSPWATILLVVALIGWCLVGYIYGYTDNWQLIFDNTSSVLFLLMLFLIQNSANRDSKAIHLKLDELLRAVEGARTSMVQLENLSEEELERLNDEFEQLHRQEREADESLHNTDTSTQPEPPLARVAAK